MRIWLMFLLIGWSNAANEWLWGLDAPPTITGLAASVTTNRNAPTSALPFTIGDDLTSTPLLGLSAASNNLALVPVANCVLGGNTGTGERTVTITPKNGQIGTARITITVTDGAGQTASQSIDVTVVNIPPTIIGLAGSVTTNRNTATQALSFTVNDEATPVASLTVSAASTNATLIPPANCVFSGNSTARTVTITPASNQTGTAIITVIVSDGAATASQQVEVNVSAPPSMTDLAASVTTNRNTATGAMAFTVGDDLTPLGSLSVSAASSNVTLIPAANCVFGGSGASRTVTITPATNQTGTANITVTVTDAGGLTASQTIAVTVNALPTIAGLAASTTTNRNAATPALAFTIGDDLTTPVALTVSAASSNSTLIPAANCVLGGSGTNRTVTITPANNQTGTATITITVMDGGGQTASQAIVVSISGLPTMNGLAASVTTNLNTATSALPFTVGDDLTPDTSLTVSASSSNVTLIPIINCVFGGSGAGRTVTITPATGQSGTATITITVTDGGGQTANQAIAVTVNALPTITGLATGVVTNRNTSTSALSFTIGDDLTAATALTLSAGSSNTTLVPPGNCAFGGSGANRTVTITPANNEVGSATITINVTDGGGQISNQSIIVTINAPPSITGLPGTLPINQYGASLDLPFTVGDDLTATASLTTIVTSSNLLVIPIANCVITTITPTVVGNPNRSLKITPVSGLFADNIVIRVTVADGSTQTSFQEITVSVKEINRPPVITPASTAYNYSLNVSGYAQILPDSVTVTDLDYVTLATPNGEPTLKTGSDYLHISARVSLNGVADQDAMVVRNSIECTLNNKRGSKYDIVQRGTSTVLAEAILADDGSLTITAKDGAETVATTVPTGGAAPGRAAVLGWLLKTISYTNLAGRFATTTNPTRTVEIQVIEGRPSTMPGGQDPVTVTSVITHLLANEPPANVAFNTIVVSPGGSGQLEFASVGGAVPVFDDKTPNDDLQFTVVRNPNSGDVIDLATETVITSFAGNRLNPAHALYAGGIGYRNVTAIGADGFSLKVSDASNLFTTSDVAIRITTNVTDEARIVSDPLLAIDRGTTKLHPLNVVGPTSTNVVFAVSALPGFAAPPNGAIAVPTGLRTGGDGVLSTAKLTITAPATGNYLAFLLTCTIGTRVTAQPFVIRLLPIATAGAAN
jgi:hypothetical protein